MHHVTEVFPPLPPRRGMGLASPSCSPVRPQSVLLPLETPMGHGKVSRRTLLQGMLATAMLALHTPSRATAQSRAETLVAIGEFGPNTLGIHGVGANRPSYAVAWNC